MVAIAFTFTANLEMEVRFRAVVHVGTVFCPARVWLGLRRPNGGAYDNADNNNAN